MASQLAEIRTILLKVVEDSAATRADVAAMKKLIDERGTRLDGHDRRLRKVEVRQGIYAGGASVIGLFVGAALRKLGFV